MRLAPLTVDEARAIAQWHYDGPFAVYDWNDDAHLDHLSDHWGGHCDVDGVERLVGFVVYGAEARVPGLPPRDNVVDIGIGVHPEMLGRGIGVDLAQSAVDHAFEALGAQHLRAAVQTWNLRSQALCFRMGFHVSGQHTVHADSGADVQYEIFMRSR